MPKKTMQPTEEELKKMSPEQLLELQKQNCIFCKIIAGEIPSKKLYQDEHCVAVLDINPASEGHVLLLPKDHYQILPQMPEEVIARMFVVAKELSHAILKAFNAKGTNIFVANGAIAGQRAPHFMIHVFQRKQDDGILTIPAKPISEKDLMTLKNHLLPFVGGEKQQVLDEKKDAQQFIEDKKELDAEIQEEKEEKKEETKQVVQLKKEKKSEKKKKRKQKIEDDFDKFDKKEKEMDDEEEEIEKEEKTIALDLDKIGDLFA
ncbi:HIT domain-containing protein [Candidatus Woesearchaeota archaeon]|nr:MAG: HIT domain-containing protein [Candidatus Woesearchaeota archaeon]